MTSKRNEIMGYLSIMAATLIIGFSFMFVKIALTASNPINLLAHRFNIATFTIVLLLVFKIIKIPQFSFKTFLPVLLLSVFYPVLFFAFQTFGMEDSSVAEAGIIYSTLPIITLVMTAIFLKEKTTLIQKFSILLTVIGIVYIIYMSDKQANSISLKGNILLILSVLAIVIYYVFGKKISKNYNVIDITVSMVLLSFIIFNAIAVYVNIKNNTLSEFFSPLLNKQFLISIIFLGVLSTFLTSFLTNYALGIISASIIAVFNNISPIISIFVGIIFMNDIFYSYQIIGCVLVLLGVIGTMIFDNKRIKRA